MGLDIYIDKCRKPTIKEENGKKYRDYEEREEMCYWRKFYGLLDVMKYGDSEYGKDVRLTLDDAERLLEYATHHRDYFDGFDGVPQLCELIYNWDNFVEEGFVINFNANW